MMVEHERSHIGDVTSYSLLRVSDQRNGFLLAAARKYGWELGNWPPNMGMGWAWDGVWTRRRLSVSCPDLWSHRHGIRSPQIVKCRMLFLSHALAMDPSQNHERLNRQRSWILEFDMTIVEFVHTHVKKRKERARGWLSQAESQSG